MRCAPPLGHALALRGPLYLQGRGRGTAVFDVLVRMPWCVVKGGPLLARTCVVLASSAQGRGKQGGEERSKPLCDLSGGFACPSALAWLSVPQTRPGDGRVGGRCVPWGGAGQQLRNVGEEDKDNRFGGRDKD